VRGYLHSTRRPIGEQAEVADLRWLVGPTCDLPAVLNNGLIGWAKSSWYLEETDATEPTTNVPKILAAWTEAESQPGHHSYKIKALSFAKGKFDELANKSSPLKKGVSRKASCFKPAESSCGCS